MRNLPLYKKFYQETRTKILLLNKPTTGEGPMSESMTILNQFTNFNLCCDAFPCPILTKFGGSDQPAIPSYYKVYFNSHNEVDAGEELHHEGRVEWDAGLLYEGHPPPPPAPRPPARPPARPRVVRAGQVPLRAVILIEASLGNPATHKKEWW